MAGSIDPVSLRAKVVFPFSSTPGTVSIAVFRSVSATRVQAQTSNLAGSPSRSFPLSHQYCGASRMDSRVFAFAGSARAGPELKRSLMRKTRKSFASPPAASIALAARALASAAGSA